LFSPFLAIVPHLIFCYVANAPVDVAITSHDCILLPRQQGCPDKFAEGGVCPARGPIPARPSGGNLSSCPPVRRGFSGACPDSSSGLLFFYQEKKSKSTLRSEAADFQRKLE